MSVRSVAISLSSSTTSTRRRRPLPFPTRPHARRGRGISPFLHTCHVPSRARKPGFDTLAIHAGQEPEGLTGAVTVPIFQTSTFAQVAVGKNKGYEYEHTPNPTRTALESCPAAPEDGRWGPPFGQGMVAIDARADNLAS